MARVVICNLKDGRRIQDLPFLDYSWQDVVNGAGTLSCRLPLTDPDVRALDVYRSATPGRTLLAVVEGERGGERVMAAGELAEPSYDDDEGVVEFSAAGAWSLFGGRHVLPPAAYIADPAEFLIPDPADTSKSMPNPAFRTEFTNVDYGSLVFGLVRQALAHPDGALPILVPADRAGTRKKEWQATDMKRLDDAIRDIVQLEDGPDVDLVPYLLPDAAGYRLQFELRAGTDAQPDLTGDTVHRFDTSVEDSDVRRVRRGANSSRIASVGWATGGKVADRALVSRSTDRTLLDAGWPLREGLDTSHGDVTIRATLDGYAAALTRHGRTAETSLTFEVRKDSLLRRGVRKGDRCQLIIRDDLFLPDSPPVGAPITVAPVRVIVALAGDEGDWVRVTTVEA